MTTKHDAVEEFLVEKVDTIVRQLPPEERERVKFVNGKLSGPPDLVRKVKSLLRREDAEGTAGD
jgi:hypothetical protein